MFKLILILFISFFSTSAFSVQSATAFCNSSPCGNSLYGDKVLYGTVNSYSRYDSICADYRRNDGTVLGGSMVQHNATWDKCLDNNGNPAFYVIRQADSCPVGSTATSPYVCTCTPPNVDSPDNRSCVEPAVTCPEAGSSVGQEGYIDVGTSPIAMPPRACDDGCPSQYVGGGVEYSRLVDGVKHYYVKGGYIAKAGTCVDGEPTLPRNEVLDADGCTSSQSKITMGGRTKCIDSDTNTPANPNSASAVADAKSLDDAARAAAIDAASSAAAAAGLDAAGIAAAAAGAASNYGSGGSPNGSGNDPVLSGYCKENPTAKICADDEFGTVDDSEVTNQDRSVAITPVPIGSSGVCPAPTPFTIAGRTGYFSWTTYCNFASGIKPILLVFAWLSAAGILIGGLRD